MSEDLELAQIAQDVSAGIRVRLGDLRLERMSDVLAVTGWTNFTSLENLTQAQALKELVEIKAVYASIERQCSQFLVLCGATRLRFILDFDYGSGAVGICEEEGDLIKWISRLKP